MFLLNEIIIPNKKEKLFFNMKSVNLHSQVSRLVFYLLALLVLFPLNLSAQDYDISNGEKLFKSTCAACHKLEGKLVGPGLKGITEKREMDWLLKWIKDSPGLINSGDKLAIQVFEENNKLPMVSNPHLSDQDIVDILAYVEGKPDTSAPAEPVVVEIDPAVDRGKALFKTNCAACHKLEGMLIGPELLKITETRDAEWLKLWIKDNTALIASGDKLANDVADSNPAVMTPFPYLSDEDIDDILKYLAVGDIDKVVSVSPASGDDIFSNPGMGVWTTLLLTLLAFVLLTFIVAATTNRKAVDTEDEENMLKAMFYSPFLRFLAFIFVLLGSTYLLFGWLMQIDVNEGYEPIQPIAFSHVVHAGDNKIDCQYCHSSAKNSKTSGIPSTNVCMNCHKTVSEYNGELFGDYTKEDLDNEIQKIYDAVGWDKENMQYIEGYEQKAVEWVRIHNLADFVYYNHSQHVTVAGLDCQKCHGPVEEMHNMRQFSPLTMGWCIDCHRDTEVDLTESGYYTEIHDQLMKKYDKDNFTIAELGGMECGKCHY
jgi:mono/diheme cytochrome c family protein